LKIAVNRDYNIDNNIFLKRMAPDVLHQLGDKRVPLGRSVALPLEVGHQSLGPMLRMIKKIANKLGEKLALFVQDTESFFAKFLF
jgi:hypothetical protein